MPPTWPELLEEGERLHTHLLQHYEMMIGERMEHFDIHYTSYATACEHDYINERYGDNIKEALRPWIEEEHRSGRLFDRDNWKPFRDILDYMSMYYGYRHLFVFYDILYFQLTICDQIVDQIDGTLGRYILFEVALYGWKEGGREDLAPSRHRVADGDRMPDREWMRK